MANEPLISVVLPTHNRAGTLPRAIAGILRQDWEELELVVVDDGSTDGTFALLARMDDPRLRCVRIERNCGASGARNRGVELARGEWIAFQDSDDEWERPDRLRMQWLAARSLGDDFGLVACCMHCPERPDLSFHPIPGRARVSDAADLLLLRLPGTPCWLARRHDLMRAGLFDERLDCFEDWELALRLSEFTRIGLLNEVLHTNHFTRGGLFSNEAGYERNLREILQRHGSKWDGHRRELAAYLTLVGHMAFLHGSALPARRSFCRAIVAWPRAWRPWMSLLVSFCGRGIYGRMTNAVRARRIARFTAEWDAKAW